MILNRAVDETTESDMFISATMNALMSLNASMSLNTSMSLNASISLDQLIVFSSKARKQLLQTFNSEDQRIAQTLKFILDALKKMSKKQRTQLHE
jgi:hypothetical protein